MEHTLKDYKVKGIIEWREILGEQEDKFAKELCSVIDYYRLKMKDAEKAVQKLHRISDYLDTFVYAAPINDAKEGDKKYDVSFSAVDQEIKDAISLLSGRINEKLAKEVEKDIAKLSREAL